MSQQVATPSLTEHQQAKAAASVERLKAAVAEYGQVTYSNSLGAESMVLTDLIWTHVPEIDIFTLDTGRLHEETYTLMDRLEGRFKRRIRIVHPDGADIEAYAREQGLTSRPMFNHYNFGGYLIGAGVPTFIDGRGELFGGDFIKRYSEAVNLRGDTKLEDMLGRYKVEWTFLTKDAAANRLLARLPGWRQAFSDDQATIFVREK